MKKSARFLLTMALLPFSLASCGSDSQGSSQCSCVSIVSIVKTGSNGNVDIYTITYSDGTSSTFEIKNGEDGSQGDKGDKGDAAVTYVPCIFNNWDGTKLYEFYFKKGSTAVYDGVTPTKADSTVDGHTAHWTWKGWDKSLENITEPAIFTATFESLVNVTFMNYDGSTILATTVNFGETPSYTGDTPSKPSEMDGSTTIEWTFKGWDMTFGPIYEDTVYTAVFDSPNAVKCTFVNDDGTVLGHSYCGVGGRAVYDGETPTKTESESAGTVTRYIFKGWDKSVTNIQADTTFVAQYDEFTYYVCKFMDWDGTELKQVIVARNGTADYGSTPHRDPVSSGDSVTEYTFSSWGSSTSGITAPTTFTATYTSKTYEGYIVTFNDANGNMLAKTPVATGETAYYPNSVSELVDACYSYDSENVTMFVGWGDSLESITSAKTFTAQTKTISRQKNGEYPQTKVTDSSLLSGLNGLTVKENQGYYSYNGEKYSKGTSYPYVWRKVEPIKWRYLRNVSLTVAEFMSEKILATHVWNGTTSDYEDGTHANNYAKSDIRAWLNGDFLNQAFYYDQSLIQTVTVDNGPATTYSSPNQYACANTTDKIYLPSYQDVTNKAYGFSSIGWDYDTNRIAYNADGEAGYWWTRSPGPATSYDASLVNSEGDAWYGDGCYDDVYADCGVRPCLQLSVA